RARAEADTAREAVASAEVEARAASDALAQVRARRAQAIRSAQDAMARINRLTQQVAEVDNEARSVAASLDADETLSLKRAALTGTQAAATAAEQAAMLAEETATAAQGKLDAARPRLAEIDAALNRLEAEAATLGKMLNVGASLWPAIVDQLKVTPGYETALGA